MTDEQPVDPHAALHDDDQLFSVSQHEGWTPIGETIKLVDAGGEAGVTIAATATDQGTIAIATVVTQDNAGKPLEQPTSTSLQLDPAALIRMAGLVPVEYLDPHAGGAEIIQLHPGPAMNDVVVVENGITNAPCQAGGCERRIQLDPATGEWDHLPDALGLKPAHAPVPPPALLVDDTADVEGEAVEHQPPAPLFTPATDDASEA